MNDRFEIRSVCTYAPNIYLFIYNRNSPVPFSVPTVPKSGTVAAKTPLNAAIVPDFGTVGALTEIPYRPLWRL